MTATGVAEVATVADTVAVVVRVADVDAVAREVASLLAAPAEAETSHRETLARVKCAGTLMSTIRRVFRRPLVHLGGLKAFTIRGVSLHWDG